MGSTPMPRSYSVWSHLATMVFVQLAHAFSLYDVCDWPFTRLFAVPRAAL